MALHRIEQIETLLDKAREEIKGLETATIRQIISLFLDMFKKECEKYNLQMSSNLPKLELEYKKLLGTEAIEKEDVLEILGKKEGEK